MFGSKRSHHFVSSVGPVASALMGLMVSVAMAQSPAIEAAVPTAKASQLEAPSATQSTSPNRESSRVDELVLVHAGELPILISAPHGGTLKIVGVEPRTGQGMATGPSGFFAGRDGGTEELAQALVRAIEHRFGRKPYAVISATHRRYLDPNRPPDIAFEDVDALPVYERYHDSCRQFCREIQQTYHGGLLLDIHGQGTSAETVYRGTSNGKTVSRLRERFGDHAHTGPQSFFGLLANAGWNVYPNPFDGKEQSGFTGGYIVQTHGSHRPDGIDAIQLEFGANYRSQKQRDQTAQGLTETIAQYLSIYMPAIDTKVPPRK